MSTGSACFMRCNQKYYYMKRQAVEGLGKLSIKKKLKSPVE